MGNKNGKCRSPQNNDLQSDEGKMSSQRSFHDVLKKENELLKDQMLCVVCKDRLRCYCFQPCGHFMVCDVCVNIVANQTCPACGVKIFKFIFVFTQWKKPDVGIILFD